jgi:glycosyltransferase involved in cell wall biosynthesis
MKKILFYTPFITIGGGVQKVTADYVNLLTERGYEVDLIVDFNMGEEVEIYKLPKNIQFQYIKSEKVSNLIYFFRTLGKKNKLFNFPLYALMIIFDFYYFHTKVKNIVRDGKYDYTISFYQFLPAYLTNIKSSKHIIWLHGSVEHFFGGIKNLFKKSYEKKLNKYDYVITIADEMKEQLEIFYPNLSKDKIKRIYNPFDFEEIYKKIDDVNTLNNEEKELINDDFICTVGRLDEGQKDFITLINAYEFLYKNNKIKEKLYIIGDGPSKNDLVNIVKQKNLEQNILFLGKKLNPYIWMRKAKIFILSSKFEGLPTVLIEAMTCEAFVISSSCKTGPKEILCDGECGDLFEVGNIQALANKIEYALNDNEYRLNKTIKAKERIKEFDKEVVLKEIQILLEVK